MHLNRVGHLAFMLATAALLIACGSDSPDAGNPVASAAPTGGSKPLAADAAVDATKHMVSGVTSPAKPGAPVEMKFDLQERPSIGVPLNIELAFLPQVEGENLRITFIVTDGLTVQPSPSPASYASVKPGGVYRYTLTVVPRENGAYYVSAIVLMDLPNGAEARTFSIPVIVGAPTEAAAKPEPPKDATGQPIESMPAN